MSQAQPTNVPFLASLKANRVIWDFLRTRRLFCWDCELGDILFSGDEEYCRHNLGILPSVREVLVLVHGSHATAAGSGIVPEQTILRYSAISESVLPPTGLPSTRGAYEVPLPKSGGDGGGEEGGKSDDGGDGEQNRDDNMSEEEPQVIVESDIAFSNQEDDEQRGVLPAPARTRAGRAAQQRCVHIEPSIFNISSARRLSPAPRDVSAEERGELPKFGVAPGQPNAEDIREDASAEQMDSHPSLPGRDPTNPQATEGFHQVVQETGELPVRTSRASVSKKRARPLRKAPGQRRKKTLRLSVIASKEDLVGMPSPSALYVFVLANPGMDSDFVDAMLPEGQRVCVANRRIAAQETWECRLGFAVPQNGCAQWMYDREPCHTSGFQKYDYIRHFYQFHLGLGRPSGVGNTRVDQLKAALARGTGSSPGQRKRSVDEMDDGDEPGPSYKRRRSDN